MNRPNPEEHAAYYATYINHVPDGNIIDLMIQQMKEVENLISQISEEKSKYRYTVDKWSIREVLGHVLDGERIFAYRALRFSRNDKTEIAGFEQNDYAPNSNHDSIPLAILLEEFLLVRKANIMLFNTFSEEMWLRCGIASKNLISVRAIAYVLVGHCIHHMNVIQNKYLK
jgi:hypothetical protein